jgi:hypothetical protein
VSTRVWVCALRAIPAKRRILYHKMRKKRSVNSDFIARPLPGKGLRQFCTCRLPDNNCNTAYISSIRAQLALWFRSYSESLFPNAEKVTKKACPWRTAFAALRFPRSGPSSVGPPPRAILGPSRLSRHPCRSTHYAEPPLGLPMGQVDQNQKPNQKQIQSRSKADPKQIKNRCFGRPAFLPWPWNRTRMLLSIKRSDGYRPTTNADRLLESLFYDGVPRFTARPQS